jgi:hypothetical protein
MYIYEDMLVYIFVAYIWHEKITLTYFQKGLKLEDICLVYF